MQKPPAGQPVWGFLRETAQRKLQQMKQSFSVNVSETYFSVY